MPAPWVKGKSMMRLLTPQVFFQSPFPPVIFPNEGLVRLCGGIVAMAKRQKLIFRHRHHDETSKNVF